MDKLSRLWAGRLYGTNTGNLFAEFDVDGTKLTGRIRILDPLFGLSIYAVTGAAGDVVKLSGRPVQVPPGSEQGYGDITAEARLSQDGALRGEWSSSIGTAGTFELHPHEGASPAIGFSTGESSLPQQLVTRNVQLGAIRLYREDIDRLLSKLQEDFSHGRPVVTFVDGDREYARYAHDFKEQVKHSQPLKFLKIQIQEPEAHGLNKIVVVELNASSKNEVRVQGVRESWVSGKCEVLVSYLKTNESSLVTNYRKYGLTFNQFVVLALLVVLPEFSSWLQRTVFLLAVVVLLGGLSVFHARFIPSTLIYVSSKPPSVFVRTWPTILSWLVAATASLAAAISFWLISKGDP